MDMQNYYYTATVMTEVYNTISAADIMDANQKAHMAVKNLNTGKLGLPDRIITTVVKANDKPEFRITHELHFTAHGTLQSRTEFTTKWEAEEKIRKMDCGVLDNLKINNVSVRHIPRNYTKKEHHDMKPQIEYNDDEDISTSAVVDYICRLLKECKMDGKAVNLLMQLYKTAKEYGDYIDPDTVTGYTGQILDECELDGKAIELLSELYQIGLEKQC